MKVGILIAMTKETTESIYEKIAHVRSLGFDNGQLGIWDMSLYNDDFLAEVKKACKELDFTITALWCGWSGPVDWSYPNMYLTLGLVPAAYRAQRTNEILMGAEFARKLGIKDIITHMGYLPDNPFDKDRLGAMVALKHICKSIAPYGQRFLFETGEELPNSLVQLIKEIGCDNIGINYDPANMLINGRGNSADALDMFAPYVCGFHGKDAHYPKGGSPKGKEVKVGDGEANYPVLMEKLVKMGYEGYITIERECEEGPARDAEIVWEKAYIEDLIKKAEEKLNK